MNTTKPPKRRARLPALPSLQALEAFKANVQALPTLATFAKTAVIASMTAAMSTEPETAENVIRQMEPDDQLRILSASMTYQRTLGAVGQRGAQLMMTIPDEEFERDS